MNKWALLIIMMFSAVGCIGIGGSPGSVNFKVKNTTGENALTSDYAAMYPESFEAFKTIFYPLARTHCLSCHHSEWTGAPLAFFADPDPRVAFNSMTYKQKVNLADPAMSRIVRKPVDELHNCWTSCQNDSDEILQLVEDWAAQVPEPYAPADVFK